MKNTMKKMVLLFAVMIISLMFAMSVSALEPTGQCGDNVYWTFNESTGELVISGEGDMWDYQTMDWWGGYPSPFEYSNIKSIKFGDNIRHIGNETFSYCSNLEEVTFGERTTDIGFKAFFACEKLNSIVNDGSIRNIDAYAFGDTSWQNNSPNGVSYIGKVAYMYKDTLSEDVVQIKEGTVSVAPWAFVACKNIKTVIFAESVINIGDGAFQLCTNLENLINTNNIEYIGVSAFDYTPWLDNQSAGIVYIGKVAYMYKGNVLENTTISIRNDIISITDYAFANKSGIEKIIIPDSVIIIGDNAFDQCVDLKNIEIGKNVKHIGDYSFKNCNSLKEIVIPKSIEYIGVEAFVSQSLNKAVILNGSAEIREYAFGYLSGYSTSLSGVEILPVRFENFLIASQRNSSVEIYAKENNIEFVAVDEPTPEEPTPPDTSIENCDCNCHKTGIVSIIWKILRFFYKIFGIKSNCTCGIAHY